MSLGECLTDGSVAKAICAPISYFVALLHTVARLLTMNALHGEQKQESLGLCSYCQLPGYCIALPLMVDAAGIIHVVRHPDGS